MGVACLEFRVENFADGWKIAKFMKVFSLESFPLYGTCILMIIFMLTFFPCRLDSYHASAPQLQSW